MAAYSCGATQSQALVVSWQKWLLPRNALSDEQLERIDALADAYV